MTSLAEHPEPSTSPPSPSPSQAIDTTRREHVGQVDHIKFRSPTDGYTILGLRDGSTVKGRDESQELTRGATYRFLGGWEIDGGKFGPAFKFDTFVAHEPATRTAIVTYLVKLCDGIGERRAARLFEKYGADTCKVLREDPGRVAADGLLAADVANEASKDLRKASQFEETKLDLFGLFAARGFPGSLIEAAISAWGAKAPAVIRRNPFALLVNDLPGCGFKRCDRLWGDLKLPADALKRQMLCAWNEIRNNSVGHTWVKVERVIDAIRETIAGTNVDPIRALKLGLRSRWFDRYRDADGQLWIAEMEKANDERKIAQSVSQLLAVSGSILWPAVHDDEKLSDHQKEAINVASRARLGILSGSPGTGKTFSAAALIRRITKQYGERSIAMAAPTGKAAVRMTQAMLAAGVPLRAVTIHTLLGIGRNGHDGKGWGFQHNAANPLPYQFLIVDETSMVDSSLMASLLQACGKSAHVLLIGDTAQLSPVGHGAPLRDLIAAGIPSFHLTEIRRNAGSIVKACAAIRDGKPFTVDTKYDPNPDDPKNLRLIEAASAGEAAESLERTLSTMRAFDPVWQTQVLVATNKKSEISRQALNGRLQKLLNPDGREEAGNPFRLGDKVICLKNSWMTVVELKGGGIDPTVASNYADMISREDGEPLEAYVANGEIGRVEAIGAKLAIVRFSEAEHVVRIPIGKQSNPDGGSGSEAGEDESRGAAGNFDLAYAITTHKAQGSEFPCVFVMLDEAAGMIAGREWLYTALSRASRLCVMVGKKATADKQARRVALVKRKTLVVERIAEAAKAAREREAATEAGNAAPGKAVAR